MNILLITLDQFRGDTLGCAGHPVVETPNLDQLAAEGVRLARHYSQAAPCGPGRASLYTGLYQMNHRVVANGTPLDARFDNVAKAARRAGYVPTLFGYTDQAIDPRLTDGPDDPRLSSYEEVLPGFEIGCHLPAGNPKPWMDWLKAEGYEISDDPHAVFASEPERGAEHSAAVFLTDHFLAWHATRESGWFAHLSHYRPHPPYAGAGPTFSTMYDPEEVTLPIPPSTDRHWLHEGFLRHPLLAAPKDEAAIRHLRAQYYGMVTEVDYQLHRVWSALKKAGQWDDTFIVVTSDHGDQLGDHGLIEKHGFFEESFHIPCILRDPRAGAVRGAVIDAFTENVDIFPTLCEAMGLPVPAQCDGLPLTFFIKGEVPPVWRDAAHWEYDWRGSFIPNGPHAWPWDRRLERQNLAARRDATSAYVHFADGSFLSFDLAADPTWRTKIADASRTLEHAQALLTWRARHTDRTLTGMLVENGGIGRWPEMPSGWGT
jgi:arylsulfatase A-like enzyme